jgi:hypothetical protein
MAQDINSDVNRALMEDIWKQIPKETKLPPGFSGEYIRYIATDPKFLYLTGFVDTRAFTLEDWEAAFQDCKQAEKPFHIKSKFLTLGKYKYTGNVKKPLDAMQIREGWYELNAWHEFAVKCVIPSTTVTVEELVKAEKVLKEQGKIVKGRILIDKSAKLRVKAILDSNPSPIRRRELAVDEAHRKKVEAAVARSKSPIVRSGYEKGAKVGTKEVKNLSDTLLKTAKTTAKGKEDSPTLSLKDLRKTSKSKKQTL